MAETTTMIIPTLEATKRAMARHNLRCFVYNGVPVHDIEERNGTPYEVILLEWNLLDWKSRNFIALQAANILSVTKRRATAILEEKGVGFSCDEWELKTSTDLEVEAEK